MASVCARAVLHAEAPRDVRVECRNPAACDHNCVQYALGTIAVNRAAPDETVVHEKQSIIARVVYRMQADAAFESPRMEHFGDPVWR
jgi:hypothetical protein